MSEKRNKKDSVLVDAAKAIGTAAGKVVALAGAATDGAQSPTKSMKKEKLPKRNNPHVPRRLKKAQKKAAALKSQNA